MNVKAYSPTHVAGFTADGVDIGIGEFILINVPSHQMGGIWGVTANPTTGLPEWQHTYNVALDVVIDAGQKWAGTRWTLSGSVYVQASPAMFVTLPGVSIAPTVAGGVPITFTFGRGPIARPVKDVAGAGQVCARCNHRNEYAEPNRPNGTYVCYECR